MAALKALTKAVLTAPSLTPFSLSEIKTVINELSDVQLKQLLPRLQQDQRAGLKKLAQQVSWRLNWLKLEKKRLKKLTKYERQFYQEGLKVVAGVDEAGRGCLAGPLVAAAVVLVPDTYILGINDSKLLTPLTRKRLAQEIKAKAVCWSVAEVSVTEIDSFGIKAANILALERAVAQLPQPPEAVISDYFTINSSSRCLALVKGDRLSQSVAAASIIAKVHRDELMESLDAFYPGYGFKDHKGYATESHWQTLKKIGPSKVHRQTFLTKWQQATLPNLDF